MDSWESVRHNPLIADRLELALKSPSKIRYASLSTKFHDGNHPEFIALDSFDEKTGLWTELLTKTPMQGHSLLRVDLGESSRLHSRIRVSIFPDGGFSRLGLFAELPEEHAREFAPRATAICQRFADPIPKTRKPLTIPYAPTREEIAKNHATAQKIDFAGLAFGGRLLKATNEHYGPAAQVISPFPPIHMFDGLESARSREPGHFEEVTLELSSPTKIRRVVLDFTYFVNNNPREVSLWALPQDSSDWVELAPATPVKAFAGNQKEFRITNERAFHQLRVRTIPDGGIHRIRITGESTD